jgi:hypothetical protein
VNPCEIPPHRPRWRQPFIYSTADIDTVMATARTSLLPPLRAATYATVIGLLAPSESLLQAAAPALEMVSMNLFACSRSLDTHLTSFIHSSSLCMNAMGS